MKKYFIIILFLLLPINVSALGVKFDVISLKNYSGNFISDTKFVSNGGFITTGYFRNNFLNFTNVGKLDAFVILYDENYGVKWVYQFGTENDDKFYGVTIDNNGDYYCIGESNGKGILVKLNKDGNEVYKRVYDKYSNSVFKNVLVLDDGNLMVIGEGTNNYDNQVIIVKYDTKGNVINDNSWGGKGYDYYSFSTLNNNNVFIVGFTCDKGISYISDELNYNYVLIKYDENANFINNVPILGYDFDITGIDSNGTNLVLSVTGSDDVGLTNYLMIYNKDLNFIKNLNIDCLTDGMEYLYDVKSFNKYYIAHSSYLSNLNIDYENFDFIENFKLIDINDNVLGKFDINPDVESEIHINDIFNNKFISSGIAGKTLDLNDTYGIILIGKIDYKIVSKSSSNGTYSVVEKDGKGFINLTPDYGYEVEEIIVKNSKGNFIDVFKDSNGVYSFTLTDDVTIEVKYLKIPESPETGVEDYFLIMVSIVFISFYIIKKCNKRYVFKRV